MKRNDVLQIRIDPLLSARIARLRKERDVNVSAWLRRLIGDALDHEFPSNQDTAPPLPDWRPARLLDGGWGALYTGAAALPPDLVGRLIEIVPMKGPPWTATITEVVVAGPDRVLVRDSGRPLSLS